MDRLTERQEGGIYLHRGKAWGSSADYKLQKDARERLAAYEDTGLMPEEIADFQENYRIMAAQFADYKAAEVTGRLILLPCKVTDTVYLIEGCLGGENCVGKRKKFPLTDRVVSAQIDHITIGGTTGKPVYDLCTETGSWFYSMEPGEFYLTQEEAERALEETKKG